jgi:tetratricopeptide (TPR) repeat protein
MLAGREVLLTQLDAALAAGDGLVPRTAALSGLGGAGKTSVAVEYAYRHLDQVGVAWQFAADDAMVLAAGFAELAAQLGARNLTDARNPVTSVHTVLARFPAPWLLIFDNAVDLASVAGFLPPAGPGRVLITSQNANWPGQHLHVPMLDPQVAAGFLVDRTGDPDWQAATEIARLLDGLPLALEQAAAYIQAVGGTLAAYLALFRRRRADLLARGEPTGYSKTVASTWELAFDRLQHTDPGAIGLLRLAAYCAPEAIPLHLLLQPRPGLAGRLGQEVTQALVPLLEDPLAATDAIGALREYSLVTPAAGGSVSVHRLVQAVTADQMSAELARDWRQAATALIEDAIPGDTAQPGSWLACAALLPHAQATLTEASDGMARIADYLGSSGSYAAARDLERRIVDARQRVLGPEHPDTLAARHDLAHWTGLAGDPVAARDLLAMLLRALERVLGPEHPNTLTVKGNLASWTGQAGDLAAARNLVADLVPALERVLGPEHLNTLAARHELARWTGLAGDPAAARDQYAELLPVLERSLGPEHPYALAARYQHATATGQAGNPAAARDLVAALLPVRERILGPEHPDTLMTRGHLARWTGQAGDAAAARDQYAELLPMYRRALGPEHPNTLMIRSNLARWTGHAGDPAAARDQYAELLPVYKRALGSDYPDTLTARGNLASSIGQAGDAAAARDQYAELLPVRGRVLGPEHPDTLAARHELARWTGHAGDPAAARDQCAELLPVLERVHGPEHPNTLEALHEFARWTGLAGDPAAARDLLAKLLPSLERVLGPEHPDTLMTRRHLARWTER